MAPADSDGLPEEEQEMSEAEIASDEEEERGSSAEGSEDEDEEGSDEEEGSDDEASPSERGRPRKKTKPFVAPPPRALPQRTTRGTRMGNVVAEEGDEEFWNQEFFQEEENDERYETESEPEDRFDADFNESEDEGDEDEEAAEAEAEAKAKEPKKKVLKPPGYKKPPLPKPRAKAGEESAARGGGGGAATKQQKRSSIGPEDYLVERRTVRESTRLKVEEGELERKLAEKYKPRRAPQRSSNYRPLTQAQLLAEAAKTEIENTKSLQMLVAIEEETRKKAQVQKRRYAGPMVRWKSRRVGDSEMTTLEVRNMAMPDEMRPQTAPPPAPRLVCAVTGQPARYRDPATGLPYASLEAFRELKRRREAGLLAVPGPAAAVAGLPGLPGLPGLGLLQQQDQQQQSPTAGMQLRQGARQAAQQQAEAGGLLPQQQFVQVQQPLYQSQAPFQQQQQQPFILPGQQQPLLPAQQQQPLFFPQPGQQQPLPFVPPAAGAPGMS